MRHLGRDGYEWWNGGVHEKRGDRNEVRCIFYFISRTYDEMTSFSLTLTHLEDHYACRNVIMSVFHHILLFITNATHMRICN